MQLNTLKVESRKMSDSRATARLRKLGQVPAVCYGEGKDPIHVSVDEIALRDVFAVGKRYTLIDLVVDGQAGNPVIIYDYQKDAISQKITHIDFLRITETSKIKVRVAVRLEGLPVGVKTEGGLLQQEKRYLNLYCTPNNIPKEIVINVDDFKSGITFYAKQLDLGESKLASQPQTVVFTITKGRKEEKKEEKKDDKKKKK